VNIHGYDQPGRRQSLPYSRIYLVASDHPSKVKIQTLACAPSRRIG
jgi:hypothetical protein